MSERIVICEPVRTPIGRVVALNAGLPVTVPGMQVDRRGGSGLQPVLQAAMHRRQARYGLETMCIGGGQGLAAVFERVDG